MEDGIVDGVVDGVGDAVGDAAGDAVGDSVEEVAEMVSGKSSFAMSRSCEEVVCETLLKVSCHVGA